MKNILIKSLKKITLPIVFGIVYLGMAQNKSFGAAILTEDFNFSGTLLTNGWTNSSGLGTNPLTTVATTGLTYPNSPASGVGNSVSLTTSGEDDGKSFTAVTSGSVYLSALVNLSAVGTGDYFLALGNTISGFPARLYAKSNGSGGFVFGVSKSSAAAVYESSARALNTTYLIVIKYTYLTGSTTDDTVSLFVEPILGGAEGTPAISSAGSSTADVTTLGFVVLRQGSAASSPAVKVDGIRIGTAWNDVTAAAVSSSPTVTPSVSTLSGFTTTAGTASTAQTFSVTGSNLTTDVTVTAPTGFEVATDGVNFATSKTLTPASGSVTGTISVRIAAATAQGSPSGNVTLASSGATTANVAVSGTVAAAGAATVSVTGGTLTPFSTVAGTASAAQSFSVSGSNLTSDITVTAPTGFEVSTDAASYASSKTLAQASGTVSATTISVRIAAATAAGALASANVTVQATGVTTANVAVSGTVTTPALTLILNPTSVAENAGANASTGTVGIPASLGSDLIITLASTNTAAATVPASVTITSGQTSATFAIAAVANSSSYGAATTAIQASNSNYTTASATLTVTNVDVPPAPLAAKGWINEFHYDNSTANDPGEFVEIVLAPGTSSNVSLVFYNGGSSAASAAAAIPYNVTPSGGTSVADVPFSLMTAGTTTPEGYRVLSVSFADNIFQNGSPDGVALIIDGVVEEFLSYEGVMTASTGAAAGYTSTDCKVSESSATPNTSLQRVGPGSRGSDFAWIAGAASSKGSPNSSQNLGATGVQGTGTLAIANSTPSSPFVTQNIFPKATAGQTVSLTLTGTLSSGTISAVSVAVPAAFTGLSAGNVTVSGTGAGTPVTTLSGSTLTITGLVVDQLNPVTINIAGLATPETAGDLTKDGNYPFTVQTGVDGNLQALLIQPIAVVTIPIANLGDVDANGVSLDVGKTVAVQGVCTEENFNSTSSTSAYLQSGQPDGIRKAGINIYSGQRNLFVRGDEYVVTGSVLNYSGLTELVVSSIGQVVRLGTATVVPTPVTLTLAELTAAHEAYEGSLVRVVGLSKVSGTWALTVVGTVTSGSNIVLENGGVNLTARLNVGSAALTEPIYPAAITGVYGQFVSASPFTGGGQIQPRDQADIQDAPGLRLTFAEAYLYESTNPPLGGAIVSGALTVSRTGGDTSVALVVALSASSTGLVQFPASVTIPVGQEAATVTIEAIDNSGFNAAGFTNVILTASALGSGLGNGSTTVMILEDEASAPADTIKPVITLIGDNPQLVANGAVYVDPGAGVTDNVDATRTVTGTGTVNTAIAGDYTLTYNATDAAGNVADPVLRTVRVAAPLGTTYSSWLGVASPSDAAFWDYVYGATAPGTLSSGLRPTTVITGGNLVLTYYVRQNTLGLTVTAKTSVDLAGGAGGWSTDGVTDVAVGAPTSVNGVSVQQRTASVAVSGAKKFLKLEGVQAQ
jgi:hypothetical protein